MKIRNLMRLIAMIASASKKEFVKCYLLGLLDGGLSAMLLAALSYFFNEASALFQKTPGHSVGTLLLSFVGLFGVKASIELVNGYSNFCGDRYYYLTIRYFTDQLNQKCQSLSAIAFEKTEVLEELEKAFAGVGSARNFVNTVLTILFLYLPYFLIVSIYLASYEPYLVLILVLVFIAMLAGQQIKGKISIDTEEMLAPLNRKCEEYEAYLVDRAYAKDTKTLAAQPYFLRLFQVAQDQAYWTGRRAGKKKNHVDAAILALHAISYLLSLALMLAALLQGTIAVGVFASLVYALDNLYTMIEELLEDCFSYTGDALGKIRNMLNFLLQSEENAGKKETEKKEALSHGTIRAEHISFSYPHGTAALKDVSLEIKKGETIAIVGRNGSGKSTLMRLLLGLYQPESGAVFHDAEDIRSYERASLTRGESAVFQKFYHYPMTAAENISISETETGDFRAKRLTKKGSEKLTGLAAFPQGEATMLGKEFGGVDLSGGEWQKLAIFRGIYRTHDLLCLDEPTAAIDPLEENQIYELFVRICADCTAVIVTHRMGLVKLADRVLVLKDGRAAGFDTPERLLKTCEEYRLLWESQAEEYQQEV